MNRLVLLKTPDAQTAARDGRQPAARTAAAGIDLDPVQDELFCDPLAGTYYYADATPRACTCCQRCRQPVTRLGRHGRPPTPLTTV